MNIFGADWMKWNWRNGFLHQRFRKEQSRCPYTFLVFGRLDTFHRWSIDDILRTKLRNTTWPWHDRLWAEIQKNISYEAAVTCCTISFFHVNWSYCLIKVIIYLWESDLCHRKTHQKDYSWSIHANKANLNFFAIQASKQECNYIRKNILDQCTA